MPDESVPVGADENENVILEVVGTKPTFAFEPKRALGFKLWLVRF